MASWKNSIIKENFKDKTPDIQTPTIEPLIEFDNAVENLGKSADELLIMLDISADIPPPKEQPPAQEPTLSDQIKGLSDKPDLYKATKLYKDTVSNLPNGFNSIIDKLVINGLVDHIIPDKESAESKNTKAAIREQLIRYLAIIFSYIVILNWWFLWYYSDFTFNWKSILEIPIFHIFYYAIEPVCTVLETINYYLLNIRMDADVSPEIREAMHKLWDLRPITFTVFYFVATSFFISSPVGKWIASVLSGSPTGLSLMVMIFSIITYFYLNINTARLLTLTAQLGNPLVVGFILLLMLLFVILFSGIFTPFFALYLMILSNFSILIFCGRNTFAKINEIFSDLEEAPVEEPDSQDTFIRLKNFVFRKFHSIMFFLFMLLPLLIYNIREITSKVKNPDLVAAVVMINVVLISLYSYSCSYHTAIIELCRILFGGV